MIQLASDIETATHPNANSSSKRFQGELFFLICHRFESTHLPILCHRGRFAVHFQISKRMPTLFSPHRISSSGVVDLFFYFSPAPTRRIIKWNAPFNVNTRAVTKASVQWPGGPTSLHAPDIKLGTCILRVHNIEGRVSLYGLPLRGHGYIYNNICLYAGERCGEICMLIFLTSLVALSHARVFINGC